MVAESFAPRASVSKVAQRYGVNANLLFTWRRHQGKSDRLEPIKLLPVMVADEGTAASAATQSHLGRMEIVLVGGERGCGRIVARASGQSAVAAMIARRQMI
jgi:transposase